MPRKIFVNSVSGTEHVNQTPAWIAETSVSSLPNENTKLFYLQRLKIVASKQKDNHEIGFL